jgi:hypothetical protein
MATIFTASFEAIFLLWQPGMSRLDHMLPASDINFARACLVLKIFQDFPSHRIFGRMHEALNIDKK